MLTMRNVLLVALGGGVGSALRAMLVWGTAARVGTLTLRTTLAFGFMAAAAFFMHGVLRFSVEPLLYIDKLDHAWGEAAYLVLQMVGIHGFAQAGIFALCLWVVGLSAIGARTRTLPLALCVVGIVPAFRIAGLFLGPLGLLGSLSDGLWVVSMLSIPGVMLWCALLGIVMLWRSRRLEESA